MNIVLRFILLLLLLAHFHPATARGATNLVFVCARDNDLYVALSATVAPPARFESAAEALRAAPTGAGLLLLADGYPRERTALDAAFLAEAERKRLRLYIEYPRWLPALEVGEPRTLTTAEWGNTLDRTVVASDAFGDALPRLRILAINDCHFVPVQVPAAHLVLGRVAGYDTALFGLPSGNPWPVLFEQAQGRLLVSTTKLSQFRTARYAPYDGWVTVMRWILKWLEPETEPPALAWTPTVRPRYGPREQLPADVERQTIQRGAEWFLKSRLLVHPSWQARYDRPANMGPPTADWPWGHRVGPPPDPASPVGDGSLGLLEGYRSRIAWDGSQAVLWWRRHDCNGESAGALAMAGALLNDVRFRQVAGNLGDWLYSRSVMSQGERANPASPGYGLCGWNDVTNYYGSLHGYDVYYADDNARGLLGMLRAAAALGTDRWDERALLCLLANFRLTSQLGFPPGRVDHPDLVSRGWQALHNSRTTQFSPHYQGYLQACFLWAYQQTGFAPFRERAESAIRLTMEAYPDRWEWTNGQMTLERARFLLALAWLVRVADTAEHRAWLKRIATDLLADQHASGAIRTRIVRDVPSNEAFGTGETALVQRNGDPNSDLLYEANFALVGLHEAAAATGDAFYRQAEDRLVDYLCRIQARSEAHPEFEGLWYRGFDFERWEYWGADADVGWGLWSVETGWTQGEILSTLVLRQLNTSLWEYLAPNRVGRHFDRARKVMLPEPKPTADAALDLKLRRIERVAGDEDRYETKLEAVRWDARRTAVVICDMWDRHWCRGATARVAEMAPRMNQVLAALRERGALIVHCPSDTMGFYQDHPGRRLAQSAPAVDLEAIRRQHTARVPKDEPPLPIDDSDGGCDDEPRCQYPPFPWTRQIATLEIQPGDAITDSVEAFHLMRQRGIANVIVLGVHQNMCVLGRPFAIREMVRLGQNVVLMRDLTDSMYNSRRKPWVDHFTGNDLVCWHIEKYGCPTITSDQVLGGEPFRFAADNRPPRVYRDYVRVPASDHHWKRVASYVEETPHPDYAQASEAAREAFRDLKYGVRIHWGVYAMLGVEASWPFLEMSPAKRQAYQELYRTFNPVDFNANAWMDLFQRNGIKVFAFTAKHHDGFSMFDTQTRVQRAVDWTAPGGPRIVDCDRAYSIMETPFRRDIVRELCEAARRHDIRIDLYFSHPDWFDADFRPYNYHPLQTPSAEKLLVEYSEIRGRTNSVQVSDPTPAETERMLARHRAQLTELLTRYGPIDLICLDQWFGPALWPQLRDTLKALRPLQPDVMFRARGIGNYGDYYTPEGFVPGSKENTAMPWMVIYPLAGNFAYQPDASRYHDGNWIVRNLVDSVAKGGNFMFGIGPDGRGNFHPKAIEALEYAGAWLRVNGEAIYGTRPRPGDAWREGDRVRFTRTKDHRYLYALCLEWPGSRLVLETVRARPQTQVHLLGRPDPLPWRNDETLGLTIELPATLQDAAARPSRLPCAFRIEGEAR